MERSIGTHLLASVTGGLVVAGSMIALGLVGKQTTQAIVSTTATSAAGATQAASPEPRTQGIYLQDARAVVFVRAHTSQVVSMLGVAPVQRAHGSSTGSGFLVKLIDRGRMGLVITTYHEIEGANAATGVSVQFNDGGPLAATVLGANQSEDLALLRVNTSSIPALQALGPASPAVSVGEPTLSITNPFASSRTLSTGIVSALQPELWTPNGIPVDNVIETDAPPLPGQCGSPLLDARGGVIGVNSEMLAATDPGAVRTGDADVVQFAVPVATVKEFIAVAGNVSW